MKKKPALDRRSPDPRIDLLVREMAEQKEFQEKAIEDRQRMQEAINQNTEITAQIRDLLTSMRVLTSVAKWVSGIAAAAGSIWVAFRQIKGGG